MRNLIADLMQNQNATTADWIVSMSWTDLLLALATAIVCGIIIYLVYRFFYRGSFYNDNFNALLVMVTVITALIITTVSSNLALSLGMVGALSIVRFRAAIKDPLDVAFIFLAIAAGLTAGAGLYPIALLGTVVIALVYVAMGWLKVGKPSYLIVAKYDEKADNEVKKLLAQNKVALKNKTQHRQAVELTVEVKGENGLDEALRKIKGVNSVIKVEYNGDYLG